MMMMVMVVDTDQNECSYDNGGCVHLCHNAHGGYACSCYSGFRLHHNGQDCIGLYHRVIYSTRVNTPIRTAENFEAVEWATGFSIKNCCIEACFSSPIRT